MIGQWEIWLLKRIHELAFIAVFITSTFKEEVSEHCKIIMDDLENDYKVFCSDMKDAIGEIHFQYYLLQPKEKNFMGCKTCPLMTPCYSIQYVKVQHSVRGSLKSTLFTFIGCYS